MAAADALVSNDSATTAKSSLMLADVGVGVVIEGEGVVSGED